MTKVTTPPPFRKLSTGPFNANSQVHAAALAAATAKYKATATASDKYGKSWIYHDLYNPFNID